MARSDEARTRPDIVGLGPVGVSVTELASAWAPSLALALGPLAPHDGPASLHLASEPWADAAGDWGSEVGTDLFVARRGAELDVVDRRAGVRGRSADGRVRLAAATDPPGTCGRVLPLCLGAPMLRAGASLLHAGVIGTDGRAVLVIGPTGAGKSTAVAAARAAGLGVLSDDLAVVWSDDRWRVHGLARPVRVVPELAPGAPPVADDARGRVSPEGWASGGTADLVGVVQVGHGTVGAVAVADPVAVARGALAASFATAEPTCVAPALAVGRRLAENLPAWDLRLAADPAARLGGAGLHLRDVFGGR